LEKRQREIALISVVGPEWIGEIRQLFVEYAASLGIDLCFQDFDAELASLPGKYAPPDGALILARADDKVAGCVALRRIDDSTCEMKRLYLRDAYRSLGLGRMLVEGIIVAARARGFRAMRLDTLASMVSAQKLYASFGFYHIAPYVYNPVEGARYMELTLG
jgi:ribosomal protein S18 acetylase RimI-like enzyme